MPPIMPPSIEVLDLLAMAVVLFKGAEVEVVVDAEEIMIVVVDVAVDSVGAEVDVVVLDEVVAIVVVSQGIQFDHCVVEGASLEGETKQPKELHGLPSLTKDERRVWASFSRMPQKIADCRYSPSQRRRAST
jgi:hypothetical protein